jgi:hypothetical protein
MAAAVVTLLPAANAVRKAARFLGVRFVGRVMISAAWSADPAATRRADHLSRDAVAFVRVHRLAIFD